jgi:hypothetical protein
MFKFFESALGNRIAINPNSVVAIYENKSDPESTYIELLSGGDDDNLLTVKGEFRSVVKKLS